MFHVTSAQVESTARIDTQKTHLSPTDQDNHAKIAQQIAIPELVHSETETPQVVVHSETSKKEDTQVIVHSETSKKEDTQVVVHSETSKREDNYENLLAAAGTRGRVVQAFTLLQEIPEAQVCLSDPVCKCPGIGCSMFVPFSCYHQAWI